MLAKTLSKTFGLSLDAQPAAFTRGRQLRHFYYNSGMRKIAAVASVFGMALALGFASREPQTDARLKHASRRAEQNGWIWVHLEGSPADIGYQHGYLLAPEIRDTLQTVSLEMNHDEKKDWQFFRERAQNMLWPHVEAEYRAELQGIADGAAAHGVKLDLWDVVALNAWLEMPYFDKWDAMQRDLPVAIGHAGTLQRFRGDRQLYQGRPRGDRAQQLDQLLKRASAGTSSSIWRPRRATIS